MGAVQLLGLNTYARACFPPADEFLIAGGAVAAPEAAKVQRLEDIGLSLCIRAGEHGHAAAGRNDRLPVISEVFQAQRFDVHRNRTFFLITINRKNI